MGLIELYSLSVFWLVGSGESSTLSGFVLFSVVFLALSVLTFIKNRLLATFDSDHYSEREDRPMTRLKMHLRVCVASVVEVVLALGMNLPVVVEPLAQKH